MMQTASLNFVDALAGTPSSIAVTTFATSAPAAGNTNLSPISVETMTGVSTVKDAIASSPAPRATTATRTGMPRSAR